MFGLKKKEATEPADSAVEESSAAPASRLSGSSAGGYAGFGQRVVALLADSGILFLAFCVIGILGTLAAGLADLGDLGDIVTGALIFLVQLLYFPLMQSSVRQATIGKQMVGIRVTDIYGNRMSTLRSFGREFAKILSAIPFGLGFLLAALGEKKQALHDKVASTVVVREGESHVGRALGVAVLGFALPFVLVMTLGASMFGGAISSMLGELTGDTPPPPPPPVAAKAAPAKAPAPAPAAAPVPAPATEGGAKADGAAKAMESAAKSEGAAKSDAKSEGAAKAGAGAEKSAPAKEMASAPEPAPSSAAKSMAPPDVDEKKPAPRARRARPAAEGGAAAPAPVTRPGIAPMECVIKPVMTDDEIDACRRPDPAATRR